MSTRSSRDRVMEEATVSSVIASTSSSIIAASWQSLYEYPHDDEVINDESTDSDVEKRKETKLRLQSIYDRLSVPDSVMEYFPSTDTSKFKRCIVCERPISDLVIWALSKPYHCKCLVCFVCKEPIGFRKFKAIEGKMLMCFRDYYESFQKCRICQKPFEGTNKYSYKMLYHKDCFKCVNCFEPLTAERAVELFDESYCISCADNIGTQKTLLKSYYESMNRTFRHRK